MAKEHDHYRSSNLVAHQFYIQISFVGACIGMHVLCIKGLVFNVVHNGQDLLPSCSVSARTQPSWLGRLRVSQSLHNHTYVDHSVTMIRSCCPSMQFGSVVMDISNCYLIVCILQADHCNHRAMTPWITVIRILQDITKSVTVYTFEICECTWLVNEALLWHVCRMCWS